MRILLTSLLLLAPVLCAQPTITNIDPERDYVAQPGQTHTITFSEAMNAASAGDWRIMGSYSGRKAGTYGGGNTDTLTFSPANGFMPGEVISVTATDKLTSTQAQALASPQCWQTRVFSGVGPADFTQKTAALTTGQPDGRDIKLADFDGDGDLDCLLVATTTIVVYFNDGTGQFNAGTSTVGSGGDCAACADFDCDGDVDVAIGDSGGQNYVAINDGSGNFGATNNFGVSWGGAASIDAGDFDGDGFPDIVTGTHNLAGNGRGAVFLNDGTASFPNAVYWASGGEWTNGIALGDMDNDGDLDVVAGNYQQQDYIYFNDGAGGFTSTPYAWGLSATPTTSLALGNVYLTAVPHALQIVAGYNGNSPIWFYNDGTGSVYDSGIALAAGGSQMYVRDVELADFDGDYSLDAAFGLRDMGGSYTSQSYVRMNTALGSFPSNSNFGPGTEDVTAVAAGDIDGDGDMDMVYATGSGSDCQVVFNGKSAPILEVTVSGSAPIGNYDTVDVPYNTTMSTLGLSIDVDDNNNYDTSVSATITNVTTQGILETEFESTSAAVPYTLTPTSGTFTERGVTHQVELIATSAAGTTTLKFFLKVEPNKDPQINVTGNGSPVANGGTLNVAFNSSLSALGLSIDIDDPESDSVSVNGTINNNTSQGFLNAEFSSSSQAVSYSLTPTTGTFNVASVTHTVSIAAQDALGGVAVFSFDIVVGSNLNAPPNLAVTSNGSPVASGSTLNVAYGDTLASLGLAITVSDPDADNCSLTGTVGSVTTQGILNSEFSSTSAATPYTVNPSTGTFNDVNGSSHLVQLSCSDGNGGALHNFTIVAGAAPASASLDVREGSTSGAPIGHNTAPTGGREFGSQDVGAGPTASVTIVIQNAGSGTLNVGAPALGGTNPGEFVLNATGFPAALGGGSSVSFTIAFDPTTTGSKTASVSITHDDTTQASPFLINMSGNGTSTSGVSITTSSALPNGRVGETYGPFTFTAAGGTPGYTWSLASGAPPLGLTLNSAGELQGSPLGPAGTYVFTVRVSDSLGGTDDLAVTMNIDPAERASGGSGDGGGCAVRNGDNVLMWLLLAFACAVFGGRICWRQSR